MKRCLSCRTRHLAYYSTTLMILAVLTLVSAGCPSESTDTPEESPTPLREDFFRVTAIEVGEATQGVDVDGDGSVDNSIETSLDGIVTSIMTAIETALDSQTGNPNDGGSPVEISQVVLDGIEAALSEVFSVDALNNAIDQPVQNFDINYVVEFQGNGDGTVDLIWYSGELTESGSLQVNTGNADALLGTQTGTISDDGSAYFEGDLTLTFVFTAPTLPDSPGSSGDGSAPTANEIVEQITLYSAKCVVEGYNSQTIRNMLVGGGILVSDLMGLIEDVLNMLNDIIPGDIELEIDPQILAEIQASMEESADIEIDGQPAFSIGLLIDLDEALVKVL